MRPIKTDFRIREYDNKCVMWTLFDGIFPEPWNVPVWYCVAVTDTLPEAFEIARNRRLM